MEIDVDEGDLKPLTTQTTLSKEEDVKEPDGWVGAFFLFRPSSQYVSHKVVWHIECAERILS